MRAFESVSASSAESFQLAPTEVHLWGCRLGEAQKACTGLESHLEDAERSRANRFRRPEDAARYIAGRGLLRYMIGKYLDLIPRQLRFEYGPQGKPFLEQSNDLQFNLSHAGDLAMLAFSRGRAVGVDVESREREIRGEEIAFRFFSAAEQAELCALEATERPAAFLRGWTRKEAFIKARGESILKELTRFSVSLSPEDTAPIRGGAHGVPGKWQMHTLETEAYVATVCWEGEANLSCRQLFGRPL
jgi:4'-phosphopantetheinyl transferase